MQGVTTGDGTRLTARNRVELQQIKAALAAAKAANAAPKFEYASVANCPGNQPDRANNDDMCQGAVVACRGNTPAQGLGPSVLLFRRSINPAGAATGPWVQYGTTCFPEDVPLQPTQRPILTMAMVLAAFHDTDFAKPTLEIQPKGNLTLVTLPTYFQVTWPKTGFAPGAIDRVDPARMLGYRVEIRPAKKSVSYVYGDGTTSGATTSLGGPYPEGDITKAYARGGDYTVRADITYTGQFRVNGGAWIDIPGEVVVQGTPEVLQVKTAKARLYAH